MDVKDMEHALLLRLYGAAQELTKWSFEPAGHMKTFKMVLEEVEQFMALKAKVESGERAKMYRNVAGG